MIIKALLVGFLETNCYIVGCEETKEAMVVDPGGDGQKILKALDDLQLKCKYIVLTHGHIDHILAIKEVVEATKAKVCIHKDDAIMLTSAKHNLSYMMGEDLDFDAADVLLEENDIIEVGSLKVKVLHTPGHTLGGITLEVENVLFTGDALFKGSIGRTDFPGGSYSKLIEGIKTKLLKFPPETIIYPGHNSFSTIGEEIKSNPFFN